MSQIRTNFGAPITAALGWNVDWVDSFSTGLNISYSGSYDTAVNTGGSESIDIEDACASCPIVSTLFDIYQEQTVRARTMLNLSLKYNYKLTGNQRLELSADISNLLNSRTYTIAEGASGIEPGRVFWLGLSYKYD